MAWLLMQLLVFILGLCLGSFINVVIYRLPREGVSINSPRRSICPKCQAHIAWYDNLPLISYVVLLGRCRHCRTRISRRYPFIELAAGLLTLAVFYKSGLSLRAVAELYLVMSLLAITFIDLDAMIIPDALTLPGMVVALLASILAPDLGLIGPWLGNHMVLWGVESFRWLSVMGSFLGLMLGGGLVWLIYHAYFLLRKEEGIGGGDFTLLAMIGAFLGWRAVFMVVFFGSIFALTVALATSISQREFSPQAKMPFGPFLSLAALVYLFFGERILIWYLG